MKFWLTIVLDLMIKYILHVGMTFVCWMSQTTILSLKKRQATCISKNESVLVMFQADCFVRYRDTESTQSDVLWFTCFSRSVDHFREVKKIHISYYDTCNWTLLWYPTDIHTDVISFVVYVLFMKYLLKHFMKVYLLKCMLLKNLLSVYGSFVNVLCFF